MLAKLIVYLASAACYQHHGITESQDRSEPGRIPPSYMREEPPWPSYVLCSTHQGVAVVLQWRSIVSLTAKPSTCCTLATQKLVVFSPVAKSYSCRSFRKYSPATSLSVLCSSVARAYAQVHH